MFMTKQWTEEVELLCLFHSYDSFLRLIVKIQKPVHTWQANVNKWNRSFSYFCWSDWKKKNHPFNCFSVPVKRWPTWWITAVNMYIIFCSQSVISVGPSKMKFLSGLICFVKSFIHPSARFISFGWSLKGIQPFPPRCVHVMGAITRPNEIHSISLRRALSVIRLLLLGNH